MGWSTHVDVMGGGGRHNLPRLLEATLFLFERKRSCVSG